MQKILSKRHSKGFTLIELIVVIAVIGILVLLAMPKFLDYTRDAKIVQIKNDIKVAEDVIEQYLIEHEGLPDGLDPADVNTALSEGRLWETRGLVEAIKGDPSKYVDVTGMDEIKDIKSKLDGQFAANEDGKVYYIHDKAISTGDASSDPGDEVAVEEQPYTDAEIADLVYNQGWIPVANASELNQIRQDGATLTFGAGTTWEGEYVAGHDKDYVQVADIDLSSYSSGQGWEPIGVYAGRNDPLNTTFEGSYDGGNHVINNLYIDRPNDSYLGLFGFTANAELINITIVNPKVVSGGNTGILVGYGDWDTYLSNIKIIGAEMDTTDWGNGIIAGDTYNDSGVPYSNLHVEGTITLRGDYAESIGGAFGWLRADIDGIYADVDIIDNTGVAQYVGGIAGNFDGSKILQKAEARGNVSGDSHIGGLIGSAEDGVIIMNTFSIGDVSGNTHVGGLIGELGGYWGSGYIQNSHSVSIIDATSGPSGGLVGSLYDEGYSDYITNSYYHQIPNNGLGTQVTEAAMSNPNTFEGWNFDSVWGINEEPYPTFVKGINSFTDIRKIDTSGYTTYVLTETGNLYTWGNNEYGEAGIGTQINAKTPTQIQLPNPVIDIAAGDIHAVALLDNGDIYGWGRNGEKVLGSDNTNSFYTNPVQINNIPGNPIGVHATYGSTIIETDDGNVYGLGEPSHLGLITEGGEDIGEPTLLPWMNDYKKIIAGHQSTAVIKNDGTLFMTGNVGVSGWVYTPTKISIPGNEPVKDVSMGDGFTLILLENNEVLSFGVNQYGELGVGSFSDFGEYLPIGSISLPEASYSNVVASSMSTSFAITDEGNLYGWGYNEDGELGMGVEFTTNLNTPGLIATSGKVKFVSCGYYQTVIVLEDNSVWVTGSNYNDALGLITVGNQIETFKEITRYYYFK